MVVPLPAGAQNREGLILDLATVKVLDPLSVNGLELLVMEGSEEKGMRVEQGRQGRRRMGT